MLIYIALIRHGDGRQRQSTGSTRGYRHSHRLSCARETEREEQIRDDGKRHVKNGHRGMQRPGHRMALVSTRHFALQPRAHYMCKRCCDVCEVNRAAGTCTTPDAECVVMQFERHWVTLSPHCRDHSRAGVCALLGTFGLLELPTASSPSLEGVLRRDC